jgi:hypothetical protein
MTRLWILWIVLGLSASLAACTDRRQLPPIPNADEVRITEDSREVSRISDPVVVHEVLTVLNRYADRWEVPWYGSPVAQVKVELFASGEFVGDFGLGADFFTRTVGDFYYRPASPADLAEVRRVLRLGK